MAITEELQSMNAPPRVMEAGQEIDKYKQAGKRPPSDLVEFVRAWVGKFLSQNKWGK